MLWKLELNRKKKQQLKETSVLRYNIENTTDKIAYTLMIIFFILIQK